jgi:hypothetical protein
MGTVSEVVYDGGKLLQGFPDAQGPSLLLSVERFVQVWSS